MKMAILGAAALAGALSMGSAASAAAVFKDYVSVLVPGNDLVTFETFDEVTETFTAVTGAPAVFVPGTILLTEPGTGVVSDVLSILPAANGDVDIFFFSDAEGGPPLLPTIPPADLGPILATLPETGNIQDVSQYFTTVPGNITVNVGSDLDVVVPEPATWALMLIGIGGIGGVMRLRNRLRTAGA